MSAPRMALSKEQGTPLFSFASPGALWVRLTQRCASADCPHQGKLWPAWLRGARGIHFDGQWYCGFSCLKPSVTARVRHLLVAFQQGRPRAHRLPLGLLLVNRGAISQEQLRTALQTQREAGLGRIGDWFLQLGMINEQQLTVALGQQWGCPVFPLECQAINAAWDDLLPLPLLESARAVPAYFSADGKLLHLAFADRLDHTLLYAVEQMLGCRTASCVASGSSISELLDHLRRSSAGDEIYFESVRDAQEMASTICNYAEELQAPRFSVVRAAGFVWARYHGRRSSRDLLFRIQFAAKPSGGARFAFSTKELPSPDDKGKDGVSDARLPQ